MADSNDTRPDEPLDRGDASPQAELETLRLLLRLPRRVVGRFEPTPPPAWVRQYLRRAGRRELQWVLTDVLHRLHARGKE